MQLVLYFEIVRNTSKLKFWDGNYNNLSTYLVITPFKKELIHPLNLFVNDIYLSFIIIVELDATCSPQELSKRQKDINIFHISSVWWMVEDLFMNQEVVDSCLILVISDK